MQIRSQPKGALDLEPEHCGDLGGQCIRLGQQEDVVDAPASIREELQRRNQTQSDAIRRNQMYRHPSDERNCSAAYASVAESPAACCSHPATASSSGPAWAGAGGAESRVRPKARCAGPLCTAFGGKVKHEI